MATQFVKETPMDEVIDRLAAERDEIETVDGVHGSEDGRAWARDAHLRELRNVEALHGDEVRRMAILEASTPVSDLAIAILGLDTGDNGDHQQNRIEADAFWADDVGSPPGMTSSEPYLKSFIEGALEAFSEIKAAARHRGVIL